MDNNNIHDIIIINDNHNKNEYFDMFPFLPNEILEMILFFLSPLYFEDFK